MKKYILIISLLFTGCSYKNKILYNSFTKQKELDRYNCQKPFANLKNNKISIKEKCLVTYNGIRSESYKECEFSTSNYISGSIFAPLSGVFMLPLAIAFDLLPQGSIKNETKEISMDNISIKTSLFLLTYPISSPFYRPNCDKKNFISVYKLNPKTIHYKGQETLKFQDVVNILPNKEIWIGDKNYKYPLQLNDDLTYYMPDRLIKFFCENKKKCILTIFTKDNKKLKKLTSIKIK